MEPQQPNPQPARKTVAGLKVIQPPAKTGPSIVEEYAATMASPPVAEQLQPKVAQPPSPPPSQAVPVPEELKPVVLPSVSAAKPQVVDTANVIASSPPIATAQLVSGDKRIVGGPVSSGIVGRLSDDNKRILRIAIKVLGITFLVGTILMFLYLIS